MLKDTANTMEMDSMLTIAEVAELLHIHPNTLRRWSDLGRIRAYRITPRGDRRFRRKDILLFLDGFNTGEYPEDQANGEL